MKKPKKGYKLVKWLFGKEIEIPREWTVQQLDDVGEIIGGGTPDSENKEYWNGEILWAVPTDITKLDSNFIDNTKRKISKKGLNESSAKLLPIGSIMITSRATIGECAINTKPITTNQGFQSLVCDDHHENLFWFYAIKYHKKILLCMSYGTTFLEISKKEISKISIFSPKSKKEQTKIASILSNVDALIECTADVIGKSEKLKKGLMQELLTRGIGHDKFKKIPWLFGKEIEIPEEWEIKKIDELFTFLRTGINSRKELGNGSYQYIHYGDIHTKWNLILDCDLDIIPFIDKSQVSHLPLLVEGDLIIADASEDHEGSGVSILVKNVRNQKIVSGLHTIALRDEDKHTSIDFRAYLTSINFVKIQIIAYVTGISVYGLSKKNLSNIVIPIPSLLEQQKIASILSGVDAYIQKNQECKKKLEILKKGLMQKLLTGRIRVKV